MDEAQRFWSKVSVGDCWVWTAAKKFDGYGLFRAASGKQVFAHRWSHEHLVGKIPEGMTVDHLCRVVACVNPDHMELVDGRTNTLRGYCPPAMNARMTHCSKGHEFQQGKTQRFCRVCQTEYSNSWRAVRRRAAGIPEGRGAKQKAQKHCAQGHLFDDANTYISKAGHRRCRTCLQASSREAKRRKREAARASQ